MYNWRLLLFAFFAFFHPIASFTERNHVDGRQCCDHRISRDTRYLNGNHPFKLSSETRRLDNREERRDEYRKENALVIRSSTDATREVTERPVIGVTRDFMTRFTRTDARYMSSRDTVLEQRARVTRDLQRNVNDRERIQATNLRSRETRFSFDNERRGQNRAAENRVNRVVPQREERRFMSNNNGEIRRFRKVQVTRDTRHEHNRADNRPDAERSLEINTRRTIVERVNNRDFSRQSSRVNQQAARSLDRLSRTVETRRSSVEVVKVGNNERRVERENVRGERNNAQNEISFREREGVRQTQLARQRFDNNRDVVLRRSNEARDARVRQEIRNEERSSERLVSKEGINTKRLSSTRRVEVRRIEITTERRLERLTRDRENVRSERNNIENEFRFREREDVRRTQLARQRFDNNRNVVLRRSKEARDARVRHEIKNEELSSERRVSKEGINAEQLSSTPRVEVRRHEITTERRPERLTRDRENVQNEIRFREREDVRRTELALKRIVNSRDAVLKQSKEARDARVRQEVRTEERPSERRVSREGINTERLSYTPRVEMKRIEINTERRPERLTRERRSINDMSRSRLEARTRSMEDFRSAKQAERELHRMSSSRLNRVTAEHRQPSVDNRMRESKRLLRSEAREEQSVRRNVDSQNQNIRAYDESRRHRDERRETLARRDVHVRPARTFEEERLLARREMRERSMSLDSERGIRADTRNILLQRHTLDSLRNTAERRFRERTTSENRLSSRRVAFQELTRELVNRNSERTRDVSRTRNIEIPVEKRILLSRSEINKINSDNNEENWQYLTFTLQGIYLCFMLLPLLMNRGVSKTKAMSMNWRAPFQKLIKVD